MGSGAGSAAAAVMGFHPRIDRERPPFTADAYSSIWVDEEKQRHVTRETTRISPLTRKPLSLRVRPDTCQAETQVLEAREQLLDLERPSASASAKRPGARRPARGRHMGTYGFRTCGRERRFSDWSPTRLAPGPGDPRETGGARDTL